MELDMENYKRLLLLDTRAETTAYFFFPVLYQLNTIMSDDVGMLDENGNVKLPSPLRLTRSSLDPKGIYLLDNGMSTFFWLGSECNPNLAKSLQDILAGYPAEKDEFRTRVERIIYAIQEYF